MRDLSEKELIETYGGHEGFFYKAGVLWMTVTLEALGSLAGVADGYKQNIK